jgi:serine/threonine protein kinase
MKPANLVFFGPIMKIVDLGIAHKEFARLNLLFFQIFSFVCVCICRHDPNAPGIGTRCFSAPECLRTGAHITPKADIWSAGAILYNMTYGTPPVENSSFPPERVNRTGSANVAEVLDRCLQENVHHRASHKWLARHPYTTNPAVL